MLIELPGTAHYRTECAEHVRSALDVGYRFLNTAQEYENASSTGEALKAWDGNREDVYILTMCKSSGPSMIDDIRIVRLTVWVV